MKYRVFNTVEDLETANAAWMKARKKAGLVDTRHGQPLTKEVTHVWSNGRTMLNGCLACTVPPQWADVFGGAELELTENDFPQPEAI